MSVTKKSKKKINTSETGAGLVRLRRDAGGAVYPVSVPGAVEPAFCLFFGTLMWKHYKRGRIRAMDNLRASFPDKDEAVAGGDGVAQLSADRHAGH